MKRFVSYLYSVYNNQKIHNAGFARMELRTGRNRVEIHLKENGYSGKTGTVYLFIRKQKNIQGISIGNITFRNNQADFRYEQTDDRIGQTPWQIMQMHGILIIMDERAAFLSQWDEQPVDTTKFRVWDGQQDGQETGSEEQKPDEEQTKIQQQKTQQTESQQQQETQQTESQQQETQQTESQQQQETQQKEVQQQQNIQQKENLQQNTQQEGKRQDLNIEQKSSPLPLNTEQLTDQEKNLLQESQNPEAAGSETSKADNAIPNPAVKRAVKTEETIRSTHTGEKMTTPGSPEDFSDLRTAELQPQPKNQWEQTWRYMLRTYPVLNQFAEENQVLCVRIEIKDVRLLPAKYWSMVNNSFLLHGFFNYRYLAFGRIGQNWFVGIPGIYQNQEHVMASIFGFPDFLPQKQKTEQGEQPGYWYRMLEI